MSMENQNFKIKNTNTKIIVKYIKTHSVLYDV